MPTCRSDLAFGLGAVSIIGALPLSFWMGFVDGSRSEGTAGHPIDIFSYLEGGLAIIFSCECSEEGTLSSFEVDSMVIGESLWTKTLERVVDKWILFVHLHCSLAGVYVAALFLIACRSLPISGFILNRRKSYGGEKLEQRIDQRMKMVMIDKLSLLEWKTLI